MRIFRKENRIIIWLNSKPAIWCIVKILRITFFVKLICWIGAESLWLPPHFVCSRENKLDIDILAMYFQESFFFRCFTKIIDDDGKNSILLYCILASG